MKNALKFIFILLTSCSVWATETYKILEDVTNQSIELYNNAQYDGALKALDSIKSSRNQYPNWYYYYALNQMRLGRYDEALTNFDAFIKNSPVSSTAKAYYYTGLIQFYQGEYDKALNSLDLSMDVSNDNQLDKLTDALIDKTVRYQNYYENSTRNSLTFLLGYTYDTDAINLSQDSFTDSLTGHVFNYGLAYSYKVVDKYNFVFEPSLAVLDTYTLDKSFKSNSTVQSSDALQLLLSLPIRFFQEQSSNPDRFDFSLNAYSVYLPLTTSARELSVNSIYVKGEVLTSYSRKYAMKYHGLLALDKSYNYSTDDDDASGLRMELMGTFYQFLNPSASSSLYYELGAESGNTKGINTRYKKYSAGSGFNFSSFWETSSNFHLEYFYLSYPDRSTSRTDNHGELSYTLSKDFSGGNNLSFTLTGVSNSSNSDLNKYNDFTAGLQYSKSFGF